MNFAVDSLYAEYLDRASGDKAATASLALAAVLVENGSTATPTALTVAQTSK